MIDVSKIWLTDSAVWIETAEGTMAAEQFADYPKLRDATPSEREDYTRSPYGLHWEKLDEDLCFEGFLKH